eukprot:COSAG05_NODE_445_length_9773_cov_4.588071_1_plen_196_part_00
MRVEAIGHFKPCMTEIVHTYLLRAWPMISTRTRRYLEGFVLRPPALATTSTPTRSSSTVGEDDVDDVDGGTWDTSGTEWLGITTLEDIVEEMFGARNHAYSRARKRERERGSAPSPDFTPWRARCGRCRLVFVRLYGDIYVRVRACVMPLAGEQFVDETDPQFAMEISEAETRQVLLARAYLLLLRFSALAQEPF